MSTMVIKLADGENEKETERNLEIFCYMYLELFDYITHFLQQKRKVFSYDG